MVPTDFEFAALLHRSSS